MYGLPMPTQIAKSKPTPTVSEKTLDYSSGFLVLIQLLERGHYTDHVILILFKPQIT